jgi:hypothetical protein
LKPGDAAPDFTVDAALGGKEFKFSLAVVLYLYPKSFTSVCTVEAHEFAENVPIDDVRARRPHHATVLVYSDELALGEDAEMAGEKLWRPRHHPGKDPFLKLDNGGDVVPRHWSDHSAARLTMDQPGHCISSFRKAK